MSVGFDTDITELLEVTKSTLWVAPSDTQHQAGRLIRRTFRDTQSSIRFPRDAGLCCYTRHATSLPTKYLLS